VPGELKIRDGWTKFLLRESAVGLMPEVVRRRADKVGFITPEDEWLRGPLRSWAEGVLFGARLRQLPGFPLQRVKRQWQAHQSRRRHLRSALWPWLSLHEWLAMIDRGALARGPTQAQAA
jgi:asparagine synthase (glutamine-hydrolysing)